MSGPDGTVSVSLTVNGVRHDRELPPRRLLSEELSHDLRLTGTHVGCEHGVCGACTVLVDGRPMRSCLLFAVSLEGAAVTTVEGCRAPDGGMGPVQQAFHECHALQCGFCTPDTRLFIGPTGRPLRKGAGYFSDHFIFLPGVAYGVTDNVTLLNRHMAYAELPRRQPAAHAR